jgi:uncharacterized delta-60 repeat protein
LGEKTGARENGPPAGAYSLEILESRLLLDADLVGMQPLSCLGAALDTQAIVVDLNREGAGSRESDPSVIATLPASSGQAIPTGQPDAASPSEVSDLGPVGQEEMAESEAGLTTDWNLQSPGGSSPTRSGAAGVVLDGTPDQVLCDTPEGCPGRQNGADEPVTVQAPTEAAPRGPPAASETTVNQIIFIDSAVDPGFQLENAGLPGVAVVGLDAERDGIRQITDILSGYSHLSAIHIISHGGPGQLILGPSTLSPFSLNEYTHDLAAWGESLAEEGDILLYGCSVGAGREGEALIRGLAGLTGADVAASNDPTGPAELGGDWFLETATGPVEASLPNARILVAIHGLLAPGDLDTTFGMGGIVTTSISTFDNARGVAIQSDGKIVVAGYASDIHFNESFAVVRYNADGSLDASFDGDGKVTTVIGAGYDEAHAVALQSDGKIVVAGLSHINNHYSFAVVRYNADGSLDTSFDGDGKVTTAIGPGEDCAYGVALQSDGKIVVAGYSENGSTNNFAVVRYNADGSLDTSFDGDGKVTTTVGSRSGYDSYSVALQSDGKIVVAGSCYSGDKECFGLVRYNTDGSLDTSFNGDGKVITGVGSFGDYAYGMALQSDDKIVVVGDSYSSGTGDDVALVRYNADGSLDTSFDADGKVMTDLGSADDSGRSVALQSDGKIVVAARIRPGSYYAFALVRYNADGSLDVSFDGDGKVTTDLGSKNDYVYSAAVQSDDKIVVAGVSHGDTESDFGVVRYIGARPTTAEITVLGGGVPITNGDTSPSTADGTDFGLVVQNEPAVSRTFTVRNDGDASLTLGTMTVSEGYTVAEGLSASLAPGESDTFTVQLETATIGIKSGEISLSNSDGDENPFHFAITGTVLAPADITVLGNGIVIVDGDTSPDPGDGTDFGSVLQGSPGVGRTFTVRNDGAVTLTLGEVSLPTGFSQTEGLSASLGPGASDAFTIHLDAASVGVKTGDISITTNDPDENPFTFEITGTVLPAPDITVLGNGISITDGDSTPSAGDGTDFGSVIPGAAAVSHTFTVRNDGSATLTLGTVAVPAHYTLTEGLAASLAAGASDTFTVQLETAVYGIQTGDISFSTNDAEENPFTFQITGTVVEPGNLDPTFGTGGRVTTDVGPGSDYGRAVALQADGKIVVAGYGYNGSNYDFAVVRYNTDGSLDTSFDGDGKVLTAIGSSNEYARAVTVQSDGKIVVAGYSRVGTNDDFAVVRYNPDGSLDTSFDGTGMVTTPIGSGDDWGRSVTVQPDGKIVVAGRSVAGSAYSFSVVRYNPDGSLDSSFHGDGKVITAVGIWASQGYSVVIQSDGKIVVAGASNNGSNYDFAVVRYNADGSLDTSFDGDGRVTTTIGAVDDYGYSVVLQPDGKIVVAGSTWVGGYNDDFALVRYNTNGSLDTSFDGDGKVTTNFGSDDLGLSVALHASGKIVVAGLSGGAFGVAQYNVDGSLDTSFGGDGTVNTVPGAGYGVAIQPDGRIVVAGDGESPNRFAAARYIGDVSAAEITVLGNGISIADGDTTPSAADGTDFGSVRQGEAAVSRAFTVRNDGTAPSTLGALILPTGYTLTEGLSTSLAAGASDTFTIQLDTATLGVKTGEVSFTTDDSNESPFNFTITGVVRESDADITVLGNGISITDGDTTPSASDGTDFGTVAWGATAVSRAFTVRNDGTEALTLGTMAVPAGYTVTEDLSASLAPGESDTFTVRLDTTMGGVKTGDISFSTNDTDENPFHFRITGAVTSGDLDPTFGTGGIVTTDIGTSTTDSGRAVAIQPDGKIVVAGYADDYFSASRYDFAVVRYNADGSLDTSFGAGGKVTTDFASTSDLAYGVALQSDGKIVVSGYSGTDFAVVRYNVDGSLDTSFGTGGKVTTDVAGTDYGSSVAIQSDGKIVVGGRAGGAFALVRYNADGSLDTSLDGDGKVTTPIAPGSDYGFQVLVQSDGKLVLAGRNGIYEVADFTLVRYQADGSLDTSFGVDGKVTTDLNGDMDYGYSVALQSDGKLVVAGYSYRTGIGTYFALVRYNADGSLDTSFGVGGKVTTNIIGDYDNGCGVAIQFGGKIVVVGARVSAGYHDSVLVQYNADGSLDTSFGTGGAIITSLTPADDMGYSVALQSDGKIVMAGESIYNFAVVRYNGGVTTPAEITVSGNGVSISDGDTTADAADGTDFGSVVQGGTAILRAFTVGNSGTATLTLGSVTVPAGYTLTEALSTNLASGASDTFTVRLETTTAGTKAGEIWFSTNDADENPFNFAITGEVTVPTAPEITVLGNGFSIADGDTTPSATDGTDFGSVVQGGTAILRAFTVGNSGTATLTLGSVTVPAGYTLTEALSTNLASGASDTFTVRLETTTAGTTAGEIWFSTNDADENPFNFQITGTVTTAGANLALGKNAVASTSYTGLPPSNATDGSLATRWSSQFSDNEWIYVDLGSVLTINRVVLRWEAAYGRGYKIQVSGDASTWSDVYSTTTGDGGVDDITLTGSGRYVRMLGTQRATVYGYSLWEFEVYGAAGGAPEITVLGNGVSITDGDTTPSTADGTNFGSVTQGGPALSRVFTVRNEGTATLTLEGVTVPTGFTLTEGLASSLMEGASDTFTVQLETGTVGTKMGEISFATNDADQNPFNFTITGTVTAPALPEVTVTAAPSAVAEDGATNLVYTFTRSVADSSALTVSFSVAGTATYSTDYTQTGAAGFSATSGTVVIGASQTSATVTVDPTADTTVEPDETVILTVTAGAGYTVGTPSMSTGTIQNDDASGNLALGRAAVASTTYSGLPASNATDGNTSSRWSSQFSDNEWIYVDLGSVYTINRVVLRWEAAYGRGYKIQVSGNASSWSEVYSTTTGDGGVDDVTLSSSASGRYVRMLGTQRATMYGYSLWEFEVYGGSAVNHAPAVSSFSKSLVQDTPLPFAASDFTGAFTDPDAGDSLQKIKITSLPTHGVLTLNSTPVTVNQEIPVGQIGTLTYTPDSGYTGSDSFQWNGSDGSLYAATDAAVNLSINAAAANLALGKTAVASTSYPGLPPSNATDGNVNSRWSSQFSDSQWIHVDFGSVYTINRVVLRWETAYGRGYKIQVSNDASTWSDVYTTTAGDGSVDDIMLASPASGRYVRMLGTQRATVYGYSLYELEVYGGGGGVPEITVLGNAVSIADGDTTPSAGDDTDFGSVAQGGTAVSRTFTVRNDGAAALTLGAVTVPTGFTLTEGLSASLTPGASDTFTVRLDTATAGIKAGDISFTTNDGDENPFNFRITGTVIGGNLALGKTAVASTSYTGFPASNVTDGNLSSRWSSQFSDSQWIYVDLGAVYTINQVVLRWEAAYGRRYTIQLSSDASTWSNVYSTTTGDGGVDDITLASPASGRYVRLLGTQRGTVYGYSLWEFEVYG